MRPGDLFSLDFEDSHGRPCQLAQGAGSYPQLFLYTLTEMVILDPGLAEWVGDWMGEWGERYPDVAPRPRYVPSPAAGSLPDPLPADVELRAFLAEWVTRHGLTEEQAPSCPSTTQSSARWRSAAPSAAGVTLRQERCA